MKHLGLTYDGRVGQYSCSYCGKSWERNDELPECVAGTGRAKFLQLKQELIGGGEIKPDSSGEAVEGDTV